MAKGKPPANSNPSPIDAAFLLKYLEGYSDFSFELKTLQLLGSRGLQCEHGGLYEDPIMQKQRAFDFRALKNIKRHCVRLAVECKNVRENFPMLVSCIPRVGSEAFHEVGIVGLLEDGPHKYGALESRARVVRLSGHDSIYKSRAPVGKSIVQIGRKPNGDVDAGEAEAFDKWAQCLASADDLVTSSYWEGSEDDPSISYVAVIPVLVVPDGRLWMVRYSVEGERLAEPVQTDHCTYFVNRVYRMDTVAGPNFSLSHIEILTSTGLATFLDDHLKDIEAMRSIFPSAPIKDEIDNVINGTY